MVRLHWVCQNRQGNAQAQGVLQMAIGNRAHRAAHHAPGRMAQKFWLRHRGRSPRYRGKEQAYNRLREEERGLERSLNSKAQQF
jgi:hypothetical protein